MKKIKHLFFCRRLKPTAMWLKPTAKIIILAFCFLPFGVFAQFEGGNGDLGTPYQIATAAQLKTLADLVNAGDVNYNAKAYQLTANIDLSDYQSGEGWIPIGSEEPFKGVFNGNCKKITGLKINNPTFSNVGLFGFVKDATIEKVGIEDADIQSKSRTGILAGYVYNSKIINCYSTGTVSASVLSGAAGGLVGGMTNNSAMSNCYSIATVSCSTSVVAFAGGLAGDIPPNCTIENCAALNMSVSCSGSGTNFSGRITYSAGAPSLSNNIAFSHMINHKGYPYWEHKGLSNFDGEDITVQAIHADGTLGDRFTTANGWITENGKLPGFGSAVDMPMHLLHFAGEGTPLNPYQISTAEELASLAFKVNTTDDNYYKQCYKLMNDLDLSGYDNWIPIGKASLSTSFNGDFDGNNKIITELNVVGESAVGLFGLIDGGTISNLGVENATILGDCAGGVAGILEDGTITNCYSTGAVSGYFSGGVAGISEDGTITNCYSTGKVMSECVAGGVAGISEDGTITNCYSTGVVSAVSSSGDVFAGGVAGAAAGTITNCYSTGAVSAVSSSGDARAGGVAGLFVSGTIKNCAALNPNIKCESSGNKYFGRVAGINNGGKLENNIAFSRMLNPSNKIEWDNIGLNDLDGADISAIEISEDGTLSNFFLPPAWTYKNGYLPGLFGNWVEMPPHLRYNALAPIITQQPQNATVAINTAHTLSVLAIAGDGGTLTYQWFSNTTPTNTGGTAIEGAITNTYCPNTATLGTFYYYVEVTNRIPLNGNGGNLSATLASNAVTFTVGEVGIAETQCLASLRVYPNPTTGELRIETGDMKCETGDRRCEIYDVYGRMIVIPNEAKQNEESITINISCFPAGIYFLKISTEAGQVVKKVVKE